MHSESNNKTSLKSISLWTISGLITAVIAFALVGAIDIAVIIGVLNMAVMIIIHYLLSSLWKDEPNGKPEVKPFVLWFTGLSGAGKSTLANLVYDYLVKKGYPVERLDGDTVRSIFPATGFSKEQRNNHVQRVGFLASTLEKNGIIVIASFISPYKESRDVVRGLCKNFIEVYVNATLSTCEERDAKGLYKKARAGEIKNFTGIDDPYEIPENPDIVANTGDETEEESCAYVIGCLEKYLK